MERYKNKKLTLGLDMGLNSIGWALIEDSKSIIDSGVHVFPDGKDATTNENRRDKRLQRRQTRRRSSRIRRLVHILVSTEMFPLKTTYNLRKILESTTLMRHRKRQDPEVSPEQKELKAFFDLVPWTLRKRAIEGEKLTPLEIGRILYHLAHQRGFPERNLRVSADADKNTKDDAKVLKEGDTKTGKIGANATRSRIESLPQGRQYLGYYLATLCPAKGEKPYEKAERIRSRYTYREMYEAEFDHIWKTQAQHYPQLLTEERRKEIRHALFFQFPIQVPSRGICLFENWETIPKKHKTPRRVGKKRAYRAALAFEAYRAYEYLNNLLAQHGIKHAEERLPYLEKATKFFLKRKSAIKPSKLAKDIGLNPLPRKKGDKETPRNEYPFTTALRNLFGAKKWDGFSKKEKRDRWHIIHQKMGYLNENERLEAYAREEWDFDDKQVEAMFKIDIPKGTANISEKAISYILPYLKRGYRYDQATILGSIPKAFGHNFEKNDSYWDKLPQSEKDRIERRALAILEGEKTEEQTKALDRIKAYLQETYPDQALHTDKIYHHSRLPEAQRVNRLPSPEPTRNPFVDRAVKQLCKIVNPLMKKHELEAIPRIIVEMARELKKSEKKRKDMETKMKENASKNNAAYQHLLPIGIPPLKNITKYRLWEEAGGRCIYTGKNIVPEELKDAEIEHIYPRTYKDDSRRINLTIADSSFNNKVKEGKTPYETFGSNSEAWEIIKGRAKKHFSSEKFLHFISEKGPGDRERELTQRELGMTGYITREVLKHLRHISPKVEATKGGVTSHLRRYWKLNRLLAPSFKMKATAQRGEETTLPEAIYFVAYRESCDYDQEHKPATPWAYTADPVILPSKVLVAMHPFKPVFKTRPLEEIERDIKEQNRLLKEANKIENEEEKKTTEKAIKDSLKRLGAEKADHKKQIQAEEKEAKDSLEKEAEAQLKGEGPELLASVQKQRPGAKKVPFHIAEYRLGKDRDRGDWYLDPIEEKNRTDHRHHLLDALVIANIKLRDTQQINRETGTEKSQQRINYERSLPWVTFYKEVKEHLSQAFVSTLQSDKCFKKTKKPVRIPIFPHYSRPGSVRYKHITAQGHTACGQLSKETIYGKHKDKYLHRQPLSNLRKEFSAAKANKIVDKEIQSRVEEYLKDDKPFFLIGKDGSKTPKLYLRSKEKEGEGEKEKVPTAPIKKVRLQEVANHMKALRERQGKSSSPSVNQWVEPQNNYIAAFYFDSSNNKKPWNATVISFWDAVKRSSRGEKIVPEKDANGNPLAFTLRMNDVILFPPPKWKDMKLADIQLLPKRQLSPYLYRVQKMDQKGNFVFRKHTASTVLSALEGRHLATNSLMKETPIKLTINLLGEITSWQALRRQP